MKNKYHLQTLRSCLGLNVQNSGPYVVKQSPARPLDSHHKDNDDVVLTAIDTEGPGSTVSELGIATLSIRDINAMPPGPKATNWCRQIRARHFSIDRKSRGGGGGRSGRFSFGRTEHIPLPAIRPYLLSLLGSSPGRTHVLVGHSVDRDIAKLARATGCDLASLPNVAGTLDTLDLVRGSDGAGAPPLLPQKLSQLWQHLGGGGGGGRRGVSFHNAGNDAVCNMQVLLMLAASHEEQWGRPGPEMPPLDALAPFPPTLFVVDEAALSTPSRAVSGSFKLTDHGTGLF
ncbi:hypothetical protein MBLNU459_g6150t1 [Dothideomycetes sp. NU459]